MHGDVEFSGKRATDVVDFARDADLLDRLDRGGQWFVVADFEGRLRGWRFSDVTEVAPRDVPALSASSDPAGSSGFSSAAQTTWAGPSADSWVSSHSQQQYRDAVSKTRAYIRAGEVYQANICRVLSSHTPSVQHPSALTRLFAAGNPAPYLGHIFVDSDAPEERVWLASASPELFFRLTPAGVAGGNTVISSSPIKGTARTPDGLTEKDRAENVMITDLVRNDLSHICVPGTIAVKDFLAVEAHPGLVHLVSTVQGEVSQESVRSPGFWSGVFSGLFPPGSVSGAPKSSALRIIDELEFHPRGPYCGGFGWIDADSGAAELAVGIRSFWFDQSCEFCDGPALHFGSGAGITWGSDPQGEWEETQLKASRLIALASAQEEK